MAVGITPLTLLLDLNFFSWVVRFPQFYYLIYIKIFQFQLKALPLYFLKCFYPLWHFLTFSLFHLFFFTLHWFHLFLKYEKVAFLQFSYCFLGSLKILLDIFKMFKISFQSFINTVKFIDFIFFVRNLFRLSFNFRA